MSNSSASSTTYNLNDLPFPRGTITLLGLSNQPDADVRTWMELREWVRQNAHRLPPGTFAHLHDLQTQYSQAGPAPPPPEMLQALVDTAAQMERARPHGRGGRRNGARSSRNARSRNAALPPGATQTQGLALPVIPEEASRLQILRHEAPTAPTYEHGRSMMAPPVAAGGGPSSTAWASGKSNGTNQGLHDSRPAALQQPGTSLPADLLFQQRTPTPVVRLPAVVRRLAVPSPTPQAHQRKPLPVNPSSEPPLTQCTRVPTLVDSDVEPAIVAALASLPTLKPVVTHSGVPKGTKTKEAPKAPRGRFVNRPHPNGDPHFVWDADAE